MDPTIAVALIGASGVFGAAVVASKTQMWLVKHVGAKNGQGTLMEISERSFVKLGEFGEALDQHEERDDQRFRALEHRIDKIIRPPA